MCFGEIHLVLLNTKVTEAEGCKPAEEASAPVPKTWVIRMPPPLHLLWRAATVEAAGVDAIIPKPIPTKGSRGSQLNNHFPGVALKVPEGTGKRVGTPARRKLTASLPEVAAVCKWEVLEDGEVHALVCAFEVPRKGVETAHGGVLGVIVREWQRINTRLYHQCQNNEPQR
jgi:hypothetical protein